MNVAVVGWGSLIWCPGSLRIRSRWRRDGPLLPIEFARISQDGRLTLVIHPSSADQSTYWALSDMTTVEDARGNLREREGAKLADIHHVVRDGQQAEGVPRDIIERMRAWLAAHEDLGAAIWTGLRSNWKEKRGRDFSLDDAVQYLEELKAGRDQAKATYDRAREYVTNAPPQIATAVRRISRERGWSDTQLAGILFED